MELRPYQTSAVEAITERLKVDRSTLLVMPPGTGKTEVFVSLAGQLGLRTLVLAHRDELINQAANRIERLLGASPAIEKAELHAARNAQYVVGSVQTLRRARLGTWPRDHFGLVVADEAHHAAAETHREILDYFECAKVVGVTATPDRLDKKGLGAIFDSTAFTYTLPEAIHDGWLVRITARRIRLKEVDLSGVSMRAGDLAQNELEARIGHEKALKAIADALFEHSEGRKTLVYTPMVESACRLMQLLNETQPGSARVIHGETPLEERRETLRAHAAGEFPYIISVMVLTEGFDSPTVSCIAMARPTKSRALFVQIMGRGLRLAEGKQDCLVLDFTGGATKHDLVGPEDALAGKLDDETQDELAAVSSEWDGEPVDPEELVAEARRRVVYKAERKRDLIAEQERIRVERARLAQERRDREAARALEIQNQAMERERRLAERQAAQIEREEAYEARRALIYGPRDRSGGHDRFVPVEPATPERPPPTRRPPDWPERWPPCPREPTWEQAAQRQLALNERMLQDEHLWELFGGSPEAWDRAMLNGPLATSQQVQELADKYNVAASDDLTADVADKLLDLLDVRKATKQVSPRQLYYLVRERLGGPKTSSKEAHRRLNVRWGKSDEAVCPEAAEGFEWPTEAEATALEAAEAARTRLPEAEPPDPERDDWIEDVLAVPAPVEVLLEANRLPPTGPARDANELLE